MDDFLEASADHRAIGRRLGLFHQQEEGPGMAFWHPRGLTLYRVIEDYIRAVMRAAGFAEVRTPQLLARSLWERSGHWEKFGANMFAVRHDDGGTRVHALKPMSCPGHIQIFNAELRSFRDLPLRFSEFGACHRNEPSGALSGLMRGRAFVQDDAHIFCTPEQIVPEVARFCGLLEQVYTAFGFAEVAVGFSTRPAVRAGTDEVWDWAEMALSQAASAAGLSYRVQPGEGAFYGPKLEFVLTDARGRSWQCGTIQLDMVLPERLDVGYIDADSQRKRPVMLHHAILGSLERFIAILLEQADGKLPVWLSPDQAVVANIAQGQADYAQEIVVALETAGVRATLDVRNERITRKVADAHARAIPLLVIVGAREAAEGTVSLRDGGGRQHALPRAAVVHTIAALAKTPPVPRIG